MDVFDPEKRSKVMSAIRSKDTKPEMAIRRALHKLGYRYILHDSRLPGKPDLVFSRLKVAVQVRGCFWHGHSCMDGHIPQSRLDYWVPKLRRNKARDRQTERTIRAMGWSLITVWECQCNNKAGLAHQITRIQKFLENRKAAIL